MKQFNTDIFPLKIYSDDYYKYRFSANEKIYLAILNATDFDIGKSDKVMREMVSKPTLIKIKNRLYKSGIIKYNLLTNPEDAKNFTIKNSHNGLLCEWCGKQSYILQEHHFPISKKQGGTNMVKICPNCHYTYHSIFTEV